MISGKGMFLWQVADCEGGDPERIAQAAVDAHFSHVLVKIADGIARYNASSATAVVEALHRRNIAVWGWHYVYSYDPLGEARLGAERVAELDLDGYIANAEKEYKLRSLAAERFLGELRKRLPAGTPVGLSSYRYPTLHRDFPWRPFLENIDLVMPQVYWLQATNAGAQLVRCASEFSNLFAELDLDLPLIPTGAAFHEHGWTAKPAEIIEFASKVHQLNLTGYNFWEWGHARRYQLWETVAGLDVSTPPPPPPPVPVVLQGLKLRVAASALLLRSGPGQNYPVIGRLEQGREIEALNVGGQNAWVYLQTPEFVGWACAQLGTDRFLVASPEERHA